MQKVAGQNLLLYFLFALAGQALLFAGAQKVTKNALMLIRRDKTKRDASFTRVPNSINIIFIVASRVALLFASAKKVTKNALIILLFLLLSLKILSSDPCIS